MTTEVAISSTLGNALAQIEERPVNIWSRTASESKENYIRFLCFKDLGVNRSVAKAEEKYTGKPNKAQPSGSWSNLSRKQNWHARATAFDMSVAMKTTAKVESFLERAMKAQEEGIAILSETVLECAKKGDIETIRKHSPVISAILGKGRGADFLVSSRRAITGDKIEHTGKMKMDINIFKSIEAAAKAA